jgi:hypothetical protein
VRLHAKGAGGVRTNDMEVRQERKLISVGDHQEELCDPVASDPLKDVRLVPILALLRCHLR